MLRVSEDEKLEGSRKAMQVVRGRVGVARSRKNVEYLVEEELTPKGPSLRFLV